MPGTAGGSYAPSLSLRFLFYHISAALCVLVTVSAVQHLRKGVGIVKDGDAAPKLYIADWNLYHADFPYVHSHNFYLEVWLQTGLLGLVSFVGAMLWNIKRAARGRSSSRTSQKVLALSKKDSTRPGIPALTFRST